MISKLTGRPPWEGTLVCFKEPGQWILKKSFKLLLGIQRWRGAVPRIKAFFGDSDVYMKLLKRCITSGRTADDCAMVVGQLRPSFGGTFSAVLNVARMGTMRKMGVLVEGAVDSAAVARRVARFRYNNLDRLAELLDLYCWVATQKNGKNGCYIRNIGCSHWGSH